MHLRLFLTKLIPSNEKKMALKPATQEITPISELKPRHTNKVVHVKVLHSWTRNINQGGETIEFVFSDENVSNPNLVICVLLLFVYDFFLYLQQTSNDVIFLIFFVTCTRGIKSMEAAKKLTLRVKEGFFLLEHGAMSETSMLDLLEEHFALPTMPTRLCSIKQQL